MKILIGTREKIEKTKLQIIFNVEIKLRFWKKERKNTKFKIDSKQQ
jgi:hypothetical protein